MWQRWRQSRLGFTMVEMLLTLLISALLLHCLIAVYHSYQQIDDAVRTRQEGGFVQLLTVLEAELSHYSLERVEGNRMYLQSKDQSQDRFVIEFTHNRLVKTPGYQIIYDPLIDWMITYDEPILMISAQLDDGEYYHGTIILDTH